MDEHTSEETFTLLFGTDDHPEIIGIASHIRGEYFIFDSLEKLNSAFDVWLGEKIVSKQIIMASQTTQNVKNF